MTNADEHIAAARARLFSTGFDAGDAPACLSAAIDRLAEAIVLMEAAGFGARSDVTLRLPRQALDALIEAQKARENDA